MTTSDATGCTPPAAAAAPPSLSPRRPPAPRAAPAPAVRPAPLMKADPSPVVELNRAAAVAMRDGPEVGLRLIEDLLARDLLTDYAVAHSARGELCRRLGRTSDAVESYRRALSLTTQEPQRRF